MESREGAYEIPYPVCNKKIVDETSIGMDKRI